MRRHTVVADVVFSRMESPLMLLAKDIAVNHHERWDGTGYPKGLVGDAIPLAARIVSVADVYDALVHERPYKRAWTHNNAIAEIASQKGKQFDPQVVEAFLALMTEEAFRRAA
jgi:putative two-component system response regulator